MQRQLYIDEAHTALDIFRFAVFLFFCKRTLMDIHEKSICVGEVKLETLRNIMMTTFRLMSENCTEKGE